MKLKSELFLFSVVSACLFGGSLSKEDAVCSTPLPPRPTRAPTATPTEELKPKWALKRIAVKVNPTDDVSGTNTRRRLQNPIECTVIPTPLDQDVFWNSNIWDCIERFVVPEVAACYKLLQAENEGVDTGEYVRALRQDEKCRCTVKDDTGELVASYVTRFTMENPTNGQGRNRCLKEVLGVFSTSAFGQCLEDNFGDEACRISVGLGDPDKSDGNFNGGSSIQPDRALGVHDYPPNCLSTPVPTTTPVTTTTPAPTTTPATTTTPAPTSSPTPICIPEGLQCSLAVFPPPPFDDPCCDKLYCKAPDFGIGVPTCTACIHDPGDLCETSLGGAGESIKGDTCCPEANCSLLPSGERRCALCTNLDQPCDPLLSVNPCCDGLSCQSGTNLCKTCSDDGSICTTNLNCCSGTCDIPPVATVGTCTKSNGENCDVTLDECPDGSECSLLTGTCCITDQQPCFPIGINAACCSQNCNTDQRCCTRELGPCDAPGGIDNDCCSDQCKALALGVGSTCCLPDNSFCQTDAECCSDNCFGLPGNPMRCSCLPLQALCTPLLSVCCPPGACSPGPTGTDICCIANQLPSLGDPLNCCSGADNDDPLNPICCIANGEPRLGAPIASCCSGVASGGGPGSICCLPNGAGTADGTECCSGTNDNLVLVEANTCCVATGDSAATDGECCGNDRRAGVCCVETGLRPTSGNPLECCNRVVNAGGFCI